MKVLKALIIDDEPLAHRVIERYVADIPFVEIIGQCFFATEAYTILQEKSVDLIFLDIEMPKLKGLDFLRSLPERPPIILTTAYEEYAIQGFDLQVVDYLLKPFSFDRLLKAVNRVQSMVDDNDGDTFSSGKSMFIKVDRRQVKLNSNDIQCMESYGNYVKVWTSRDMLLTPSTLGKYEEALGSFEFEKVHKSFLVNKQHIDYIEGNIIHLKGGKEVPIGKNYRNKAKTWFQS